jgi:hypothetical protein
MKFKKLFGRKKQHRHAMRVNEFMLESLEPRLLLSATPMTAAVVTTDHLDYAPGETAVITTSNQAGDGAQFAAGELVRFQVSRTDGMVDVASVTAGVGPSGNGAWYVVDGIGGFTAHLGSDVSGDGVADWIAPDNDLTVNSRISTTWFVEEQYRHSSLLVTAAGQESAAMAATAFTDSAINTSTIVSSDLGPSTYGDVVSLTARVTSQVGGIRPAGSVEFFDGGISLGVDSSASFSGGHPDESHYSISISNLTAGTHHIYAVFTGGAAGADTFQDSVSADIAQIVSKANAVITVNGYFAEYDGAAHGATGTATGVTGEDLSAGLNLGAVFTNVADNLAAWTFSGGTDYNDQSGTVLIKIVKTDATIVVNGFNAVYSATPPGPSGTPQGLFQDNSLPIPIRSYGAVLDLSATGIMNSSAVDGFRYVDTFFSGDQDVTVTVAGAPAADSSHSVSVFLRTQNPNTGILNAYYINYEEAGASGAWSVGRLIDNASLTAATNAGTHLVASDKIRATVVGDTITAYSLHNGLWTAEISYTMTGADVVSGPGRIGLMISGNSPEINLTDVTGVFGAAAHGAAGTAVGVLGESLRGLNLSGTIHTDAGTYLDAWTFTDVTGNYHDVYYGDGFVLSTIAKADAAITVTGYDVTYDGAAHQATGTVLGLLGESLSGLSLSSTIHTDAGAYADTWTFTDSTGNYNDASGTVNNSIAALGVTGSFAADSKVYDGSTDAVVLFTDLTGLLGGDDVSLGGGSATFETADAGFNKIVTLTGATLTGAAAGNYLLLLVNTTTADIDKAAAIIDVLGYTGTYDGAAHGATGSATGVVGEDLSIGLNLGASFTNVPGGTAGWAFTGGTNYTDQSGSVEIVITKATATLTVSSYLAIYDGNAHEARGTATGVLGESLSGVTGTLRTNAGTYIDTVTFTDTTGNYKDASRIVRDFIAKATATLTVSSYLATYDGNAHEARGTATGVLGESLSGVTGTLRTNAGTYVDTVTFTDQTGNYRNATKFVKDYIAKAAATLTVTGYLVTYDGTAHEAIGAATGVLGESLSGLDLSGTTHTNAGTYTDTVIFTDTTGNYKDATKFVKDYIAKATATLTVTGYAVRFDGAAHTAIGTATGVLGESLSGLDLSGTSHIDAGAYIDTVTYTDGTGNYKNASKLVKNFIR